MQHQLKLFLAVKRGQLKSERTQFTCHWIKNWNREQEVTGYQTERVKIFGIFLDLFPQPPKKWWSLGCLRVKMCFEKRNVCLYKSILEYQQDPVTLRCQSHFSPFSIPPSAERTPVSTVKRVCGQLHTTHSSKLLLTGNFLSNFVLNKTLLSQTGKRNPCFHTCLKKSKDSASDKSVMYDNLQWFVRAQAIQSEYSNMWPLESKCLTSTTPCCVRRPLS